MKAAQLYVQPNCVVSFSISLCQPGEHAYSRSTSSVHRLLFINALGMAANQISCETVICGYDVKGGRVAINQ